MELHGSIESNLVAAVRSARRLRNHPVHADTLKHWEDLLSQARRDLAAGTGENTSMEPVIAELQNEIASRAV